MELKQMIALLAIAGLALAAGCGQPSEDEELMAAANGAAKTTAVLGTASVAGTVSLTGKIPGTALFSVNAAPS